MTVRVLLADDDALIRAGLAVVLGTAPDLKVVAEAADGIEAVDLCLRQEPDVVLMDVRMPGIDGLEATRRLVASRPDIKILILTTFHEDEYVYGALRAGASGFLLKRASPERLLDAVRTVAAGEALLDPSVTRRLIRRFWPRADRSAGTACSDPPATGPPHRTRAAGATAGGAGAIERRDRRPAGDCGVDREDPRQKGPGQDRRARPGSSGRLRLSQRTHHRLRHRSGLR
jgi:DNA-binding NarL/FixJ family response regulator